MVENSYQLRWQREAHAIIARFLSDATKRNLPALMWTIATTGAITGEAIGLGSTPAEQRRAFEAWAAYLGATPSERVRRDGSVALYARFEVDGKPVGAIRADIAPPMDEEAGE